MKQNEIEINKELVEEIANKIAGLWIERMPQLATLDEVEKQERILAQELITRIRQAIVDGVPLPGEYRRGETKEKGQNMWVPKETLVLFIALCREEASDEAE